MQRTFFEILERQPIFLEQIGQQARQIPLVHQLLNLEIFLFSVLVLIHQTLPFSSPHLADFFVPDVHSQLGSFHLHFIISLLKYMC